MKGVKAVLLMAGAGARFDSLLPKQFHLLSGKRVYLYTLERLITSSLFEEIILVSSPDWAERVEIEIEPYRSRIPIRVIKGGETRQRSAHLGLLACGSTTQFVMIHDAVRPFISMRVLKDNLEALQKGASAVDTCIASADTLVYSENGQLVDSIPKRNTLLRGQTPQSFAYDLILKAHQDAEAEGSRASSDDCSLIVAKGGSVHIVEGDESNIKITSPLDLYLAEQLLRLQSEAPLRNTAESLEGKRFIVTGGTGGIGSALVDALTAEGAEVFSVSRSSRAFSADLTSAESAAACFDRLYELHGEVDGLIHAVGSLLIKPFDHLTLEEIKEQMATNFMAALFTARFARIKRGGHLILIASSSYFRGRKGFALYSAAKAALVNFSQALAEERPHQFIHAILPVRTETPMRRRAFPDEDPLSLLKPEAVAKTILDLLKSPLSQPALVEVRKKAASETSIV